MNVRWMRLQSICAALGLVVVGLALTPWISAASAFGQSPSAIYSHRQLSLVIPYHAVRVGSGTLAVELLDPEDRVLGRAERDARTADGNGHWGIGLPVAKSVSYDDLVWERVRYRFGYEGETASAFEGIRSVSEILRRPIVRVLGQPRLHGRQ